MSWTEALLVGAVVASTDAAAVFFLIHAARTAAAPARRRDARGRIRQQRSVRGAFSPSCWSSTSCSATEIVAARRRRAGAASARSAALLGILGGRAIVLVLNRLNLAQGLHAPFVATARVVIFGLASVVHGSGFLAVYLAGLVVGNRPTRAHNTVVVFLDAVTWLAQIVMFVLLGLLVWPERLLRQPAAGAGGRGDADAGRAAGRGVPVPRAVSLSAGARRRSSPGSGCAARSASFSPRSRCWSACRMPSSISTSPSWWC